MHIFIYVKGDVFMGLRMKAAAGMLAVIMLIILCQILSLKLEKRIDNYNRAKETFKISGDALIRCV